MARVSYLISLVNKKLKILYYQNREREELTDEEMKEVERYRKAWHLEIREVKY